MYRDKNLRKNTFKGINFELKITLAEMVTNGSEGRNTQVFDF
jgi:hypothetical protein